MSKNLSKKYYKTNDTNKTSFIYYQKSDETCGLAAFLIVLRYYGIDVSEKKLRSLLLKLGFQIYNSGVPTTYIGLLAQEFGLQSNIYTHAKCFRLMNPKTHLNDGFGANLFCKRGGKLIIFKDTTRPNFKDLMRVIKSNDIAIACIDAKGYYDINENWNHFLVLLRDGSKKGFTVLDCYEEKGKKDYSNWSQHMEYAKNYNWSKWTGDLIEISKV